MPDRSKVMTQTKRDSQLLHVGFGRGVTTLHCKKIIVNKFEKRKKLDRLIFWDGKFIIHMNNFHISS